MGSVLAMRRCHIDGMPGLFIGKIGAGELLTAPALTSNQAKIGVDFMSRYINLMQESYMHSFNSRIAIALLCLVSAQGYCQTDRAIRSDASQSAKPRTFALIAALGDQFSIVSEEETIGSRLKGYKRSSETVPDNLLNVLALQSLDKVVDQLHPGSKRDYLALDTRKMGLGLPAQREAKMISDIQARLGEMSPHQRQKWDLILVATPTYVRSDFNGMATKLEGFGVFTQPLVGGSFSFPTDTYGDQSALASPLIDYHFANQHREDAITPDKKPVKSKTYVAPFSYIKVWILDPSTLAVLDEQKRFQNQKIADPLSDSLDLNLSISKEFMAQQMIALIDNSIHSAVAQSEKNGARGTVEIGPVTEKKRQ